MAKFIEEFKEFAFKGNVMDMAVGVISSAAHLVKSYLQWWATSSCLSSQLHGA